MHACAPPTGPYPRQLTGSIKMDRPYQLVLLFICLSTMPALVPPPKLGHFSLHGEQKPQTGTARQYCTMHDGPRLHIIPPPSFLLLSFRLLFRRVAIIAEETPLAFVFGDDAFLVFFFFSFVTWVKRHDGTWRTWDTQTHQYLFFIHIHGFECLYYTYIPAVGFTALVGRGLGRVGYER